MMCHTSAPSGASNANLFPLTSATSTVRNAMLEPKGALVEQTVLSLCKKLLCKSERHVTFFCPGELIDCLHRPPPPPQIHSVNTASSSRSDTKAVILRPPALLLRIRPCLQPRCCFLGALLFFAAEQNTQSASNYTNTVRRRAFVRFECIRRHGWRLHHFAEKSFNDARCGRNVGRSRERVPQ